MPARPFRIVKCAEWGARAPKGAIARVGRPTHIVFHHTAGHVPNMAAGETLEEAKAYARAIQGIHMAPGGLGAKNGGVDSGHNFLVTRGGYILEGRHGTVAAIEAGRMVSSAHCPNHNDQPGIEHEHNGSEHWTQIQHEASVWLHAWICRHTHIDPKRIYPHREFYATACPGTLVSVLPSLRNEVAAAVKVPVPNPGGAPFSVHTTNKDGSDDFVQADGAYADKLWHRFRVEKQFKAIEFKRN